jgi:cysteine synthase B
MSSLLDLVGNTPLVELKRINPNPNVRIFGKLEGNNPGGSVKDRAAYSMIKGALDRGEIKPGMKLVEATSGNTGIALAMIARLFDLEIELIMPQSSTRERVLTMEAFGAKVVLTETMESARDLSEEKAAEDSYFMLNQFANPDNWRAHYKTTGPEIWKDTDQQITHHYGRVPLFERTKRRYTNRGLPAYRRFQHSGYPEMACGIFTKNI